MVRSFAFCSLLAVSALVSAASPDAALDAAAPNAALDNFHKKLAGYLPGIARDDVRPTPIPGIYEVQKGNAFGYVSQDGRYLIQGDLVDLKTGVALTEETRKKARLALLDRIGTQNMIEFAPKPPQKAKYVVTAFTDVDCAYCRMLHRQMAQYNADGIAIRYAFFPRTGPGTDSFRKAEAVWCSKDRKAAITQAKLGANVTAPACPNPVMKEYHAALELGARGTPILILPDGELVTGYLPPDVLAARLAAPPKQDPVQGPAVGTR